MNRSDVVGKLVKARFKHADAEVALETVLEAIGHGLASGDRVTFANFGTFEVRERPGGRAKLPGDGTVVQHFGRRTVWFRPHPALREHVGDSRRQPEVVPTEPEGSGNGDSAPRDG